METSVSSVIQQGKDLARSAESELSNLRSAAKPLARRTVKQAQSLGEQGIDAVGDIASQARDAIFDASNSIIAYTKNNPAKALGIAAAAGVVTYALVRALMPSRE